MNLSARELLICGALIDSPVAWESQCRLARACGLSRGEVLEALAGLALAGWIEPWEEAGGSIEPWAADPGQNYTFTPAGASALGIRLVEEGEEEIPRWARAGEPDPPSPKARGIFRRYESLALVPDPSPGPLQRLVEAEELAEVPWPEERPRRKRDARAAALRSLQARERRKLRRRRS
jgi:hypothetical protein